MVNAWANLLFITDCHQHVLPASHKHLMAWYSNDPNTDSLIDYVLVSSRSRTFALEDRCLLPKLVTRMKSDHVFVRTRLKIHLSSAPKISRARSLYAAKIRLPTTAEALSTEVRSCSTTQADGEGRS
uniref:Uncharacterized protein n=1 Tax=Schistocephalus solidus TaxID=70667 RepID=A0A0X3PYT1_SCHSO